MFNLQHELLRQQCRLFNSLKASSVNREEGRNDVAAVPTENVFRSEMEYVMTIKDVLELRKNEKTWVAAGSAHAISYDD